LKKAKLAFKTKVEEGTKTVEEKVKRIISGEDVKR
jgi:hypothetical protein